MKTLAAVCLLAVFVGATSASEPYQDRFVWIFGWGLNSDKDLDQIGRVVEAAGKAGLNGAVASFSMDTLCRQQPDYFARLARFESLCRNNHLEFIPAVFSIGYGGGVLAHDRNLAEGLPVKEAPFKVEGSIATLVGNSASFTNGDFEVFSGNKARGFNLQDDPGIISFIDETVRHGGKASLRLENFTAHEAGNARAMQTIQVRPFRAYRVTLWVKTENLKPGFRTTVLADGRELAPREFHIPATSDWRKVTYLFNSLGNEKVSVYAGVWGGKSGRLWIDDWTITEVGPVNVLRRPGTPVTVTSEDGGTVYVEGQDYEPLRDPALQVYRDDHQALPVRLLPGGRIPQGAALKVSWYHSLIIHDSQVTVCMAEPAVYEIFDHEARLLAQHVKPGKVMLNMDEVRMGGTCAACAGRDMAALLGECVTRQAESIRKYSPGAQVYVWSDMFDPNHNARSNYYLVKGDYTGSWKHIPRDLVIAVWGGEPRPKSLEFFSREGFKTLIGCYYDADNLDDVKGWLALAGKTPAVRGLMYTPWLKKYELLPEFGKLLVAPR
jgi:hypothetical protein